MPDYTQSSPIDVIERQSVTHPDTILGVPQDADGKLGVNLAFFHGYLEGAPNTNPGRFLVQTTAEASSDEGWVTVREIRANSGSPVSQTPSGITGGNQILTMDDTAGYAAGDVCFYETSTDGEWCMIQEIDPDVSITLMNPLTESHTGSDIFRNLAQAVSFFLELKGVARYRVLFLHQGSVGVDAAIWVRGIEVLAVEP